MAIVTSRYTVPDSGGELARRNAGGVLVAVVYAALVRLTGRPVRNFLVASAAVVGLMLVPVAASAPAMGVTAVGQGVLVVLHAVVAVPLVTFVVGAVRL